MPSYAKRSMSGFDCTKPKDGRFPDQHLFAKSKRLSDFIVEGENECRQPLSSCSWPVPSIMRVYTRMIETSTPYRAQVWGSRADRQADRGRKRIALFGAFTGRSGGRPERRPSNFGRKRLGTLFGAAFDHMPVDQGPTDDSGPTSR